jgi:hypothetical protein
MAGKAGRPKKVFTPEQIGAIEVMAFNQCKVRTIAEVLGESQDTIKRHFASLLARKRAEGRVSLHGSQMLTAKTAPVMQIWLGKQYLDQRDQQEVVHTFDWRALTKDGSDSDTDQGPSKADS